MWLVMLRTDAANMRQRGDTIIEVLLAVAVFSMIAIGTIVVMNQGSASAQRALEITQVKEQINTQADLLRALAQDNLAERGKNSFNPTWKSITDQNDTGSITVGDQCPTTFSNVFALNPRTIQKVNTIRSIELNTAATPPYAKIVSTGATTADSYGIWIEKQTAQQIPNVPDAFDFYIKACWYSAGSSVPMTLQTTVRLYNA